ncbi:hypothetical protein ACHAPT_010343 [Fusarium lateritium]
MSEDYWDPAALLRIGRGRGPGRDGYSCLALSATCDAAHRERRPKILRLLNQLSRTRPEATSSVILDQLAGLCLCTEHEEDAPDVVADWETIIDLANQHHRHLLRFDLADKRAEIETLRSKLDWVNRFLTWKNKDLADQLAQQGWSSQMEEKGMKEISDLRRSNKSLQVKGQQFLSTQEKIDQENANLKEELEQTRDEANSLREELETLRQELEEEKSGSLALQKRAASLEDLVQSLRDEISSCWLHSFLSWIRRLQEFSLGMFSVFTYKD